MSDYDIPRAVFVDSHVLTVPLDGDALQAVREWEKEHLGSLAEKLAPFGLSPYAIAQPAWHRVVTPEDVRQD